MASYSSLDSLIEQRTCSKQKAGEKGNSGRQPQQQPSLGLVGKPKSLSKENHGLVLLLVSAALYAAMGCFVKLATATGLPSIELVFIRGMVQGSLVVMAMFFYHQPEHASNETMKDETVRKLAPNKGRASLVIQRPFGHKSVRTIVVLRGLVGGMGFCFYYYTIGALPLGDAVTLLSLNPIVTVVGAAVFLGEAMHASSLLAALLSICGSALIAQPAFLFGSSSTVDDTAATTSHSMGYVTALLGTCTGATVYILVRKAGLSGVHVLQLLFSWSVFGTLFGLLIGLSGVVAFVLPPSGESWMYIGGVCLFGSCGHFLMNYAGRFAPAGLAAIVRSSGIMWAYLLEIVVFDQIPHLSTLVGVCLICVSLAIVAMEQRRRKREQQVDDAAVAELKQLDRISAQYGAAVDSSEAKPLGTHNKLEISV